MFARVPTDSYTSRSPIYYISPSIIVFAPRSYLYYELFHLSIEFFPLGRGSIGSDVGFRLFGRRRQSRGDGLGLIDESLRGDGRCETFVKGGLLIYLVISWGTLGHHRICAQNSAMKESTV